MFCRLLLYCQFCQYVHVYVVPLVSSPMSRGQLNIAVFMFKSCNEKGLYMASYKMILLNLSATILERGCEDHSGLE